MELDIYQIESFTDELYHGNPACVVICNESWLEDNTLLKIAKENGVAETSFLLLNKDSNSDYDYHIRWFTPDTEMDLCGHATLASGYVIINIINKNNIKLVKFHSKFSGILDVSYNDDDTYELNFPLRKPIEIPLSSLPIPIIESLNIQPKKALKSRDYILVYDNQEEVVNIKVNKVILDQINIDPGGIVVTAISSNNDSNFCSRYFTPQSTILEDPVTGSSHCSLIPYWSEILQKNEMIALQLSERRGKLFCRLNTNDDRVYIAGHCKMYLIGKIYV
jgi:PhzF family phenazine biosynthesis protein